MVVLQLLIARVVALAAVSAPVAAVASQGPGVATGTASHLTQLAMAIVIYGGCALIVGGGLIGALRTTRD